mgnify:CR=1 FL=1
MVTELNMDEIELVGGASADSQQAGKEVGKLLVDIAVIAALLLL